mmetsp:Transcript_17259/g.65830  ORF Transcript_17259/g.65830 Transcript_17259/m.65830 type:complete len:82 (+) Transcript_17259:92-337(+)|eukprot:scaffold1387_cov260-Pinguiococcus_pyrenoidosus.AAC.7
MSSSSKGKKGANGQKRKRQETAVLVEEQLEQQMNLVEETRAALDAIRNAHDDIMEASKDEATQSATRLTKKSLAELLMESF